MRDSSCTCMNRFSNTVSTTRAAPCATVMQAMSWACKSVGNPGNGPVTKSTASGLGGARRRSPSRSALTVPPASRTLTSKASRSSARARRTSTLPPVISAAASSVPASIRSGITSTSAGRSSRTPSTTTVDVPAPSMRAPMRVSTAASAVTSGSRAQFSSTVRPSASAAAMTRFSVPVTVGRSNTNRAPRRRFALAST